jgi:hypothetical protein
MKVRNWEAIIDKALSDPAFKQRLLAEPAKILAEEGVEIPPGITVKVVEPSDKEILLVLPKRKSGYKFISPYVAVCEDHNLDAPGGDSATCQNPAAGCAL